MSHHAEVLVAAGVLLVFVAHPPRRRRRHALRRRHRIRRTVRYFRRPKHTLSESYHRHINSPEWRHGTCPLALRRAMHRCQQRTFGMRCHERAGLQVHHLHYKHFGFEWAAEVPPSAEFRERWERAGRPATRGESLQVLCLTHHSLADRRRRRRGG